MVDNPTLDLTLGLLNLLAPVGLLVATLVWVVRLAVLGELRRGIAYVLLLPERQRMFLRLVALVVTIFLIGGVFDGFNLLGLVPEAAGDLATAVLDLAAAGALFLLLYRGLSPHTLSSAEREALALRPMALDALGMRPAAPEPELRAR